MWATAPSLARASTQSSLAASAAHTGEGGGFRRAEHACPHLSLSVLLCVCATTGVGQLAGVECCCRLSTSAGWVCCDWLERLAAACKYSCTRHPAVGCMGAGWLTAAVPVGQNSHMYPCIAHIQSGWGPCCCQLLFALPAGLLLTSAWSQAGLLWTRLTTDCSTLCGTGREVCSVRRRTSSSSKAVQQVAACRRHFPGYS